MATGHDNDDGFDFDSAREHVYYERLSRFGVTPREAQIARLVSWFRTNPEIAIACGCGVSNVKKNVERVGLRLGVDNRRDLAAVVRRLVDHG